MIRPARVAFVAACALVAGRADAGPPVLPPAPDAQGVAPAPLVLPELTHPRTDASLTWSVGRGTAAAGLRSSTIAIVRAAFEGRLMRRTLYAGLTYDYASALPPDGGITPDDVGAGGPKPAGLVGALGNLEPHVRSAFAVTPHLTFGFVLGAVVPTSQRKRNGADRSAMLAASSIEPTDYVHFLPGRFALRPAADLRVFHRRFVFQARQGFDVMFDDAGIDDVRTAGRILAHVGFIPIRSVELSLEASQIYYFYTEEPPDPPDASLAPQERAVIEQKNAIRERYRISDDRRTALTGGPAVRLSFPDVDVGAGLVTNLFSPRSPVLDSFVALRFSLILHLR